MAISDILPWKRGETRPVVRKEQDPVLALGEEIDRLFEDFFTAPIDVSLQYNLGTPLSAYLPKVNLSETENEVVVMMEVSGMVEKDLGITLDGQYLIVRGERKADQQDKSTRYHRMEFSYGSFCRQVVLPALVNGDKTDATFKNGIFSIRMPKLKPAIPEGKRIVIKSY